MRRRDHRLEIKAGVRGLRIRDDARWRIRLRGGATLRGCLKMMALPHLLLFHRTLQGMLMLTREVHHLSNFRLSNFIGINAAHTDALLMHMKHYARRLLPLFVEESLKHINDKLHWSIIVVQKENFVQARTLRLRTRFCYHARLQIIVTLEAVIACHRRNHREPIESHKNLSISGVL